MLTPHVHKTMRGLFVGYVVCREGEHYLWQETSGILRADYQDALIDAELMVQDILQLHANTREVSYG